MTPADDAPDTAAPAAGAPETAASETAASETAASETAAPEAGTPDTAAPDTAPSDTVAEAGARSRRITMFVAVATFVLVGDLVSKAIVVMQLPEPRQVRILGGAIYLDVARNSGAAFSLGTGFTVLLSVIALGVVAVIVRTASRLRSTTWAVALGLILGGALGNLIDRIFRAPGLFRGHVVDWISLFGPNAAHWPIFNVADSAIVCGAILAAALSLFGVPFGGAGRPRG